MDELVPVARVTARSSFHGRSSHKPLLGENISMGGKEIPSWAFDKEALQIAKVLLEDNNYKFSTLTMMGPAVLLGFKANAILWSFFIVFPWLAIASIDCPKEGGFPTCPSWLWLLYLPVVGLSMYYELQILRYILPCMRLTVGEFRLFGYTLSFRPWLAYVTMMSGAAHLDVATNSLFLAKVLVAEQCSNNIEQAWVSLMRASAVPFLQYASMSSVVLVMWLLMLMQIVYTLGASVQVGPANGHARDGQLWPRDYDLKKGQIFSVYRTVIQNEQTHRGCIFVLSEGARMMSVLDKAVSYSIETLSGRPDGQLAHSYLRTSVVRFFIFFLLEGAVYINLQGTAMEIEKYWTQQADQQLLVSICLSSIMGLTNIYKETLKVYRYYQLVIEGHAKFEEELQNYDNLDAVQKAQVDRKRSTESKVIIKTYAVLIIFGITAFLAFCLLTYAIMKSFAATLVCRHGLWNISGCVID